MKCKIIITPRFEFPKYRHQYCEDKKTFLKLLLSNEAEAAQFFDMQEAIDTIIRREAIGSTAIGGGFAFPHAKLNSLSDFGIAFVFRLNEPVDWPFGSMNGKPVKIIFITIFPQNCDASMLFIQASQMKIGRLLGDQQLSPEKFVKVFQNYYDFFKNVNIIVNE